MKKSNATKIYDLCNGKVGHLIENLIETHHDEVCFGGSTASDYACVAVAFATKDVSQEVFDLVIEDASGGIILQIAVIDLVLVILSLGQSPENPNPGPTDGIGGTDLIAKGQNMVKMQASLVPSGSRSGLLVDGDEGDGGG